MKNTRRTKAKGKESSRSPLKRSARGSSNAVQGERWTLNRALGLLFLLWVAFAAVTLTFPNFSWLMPSLAKALPFQSSLVVSFLLFAGMVAAVRLLPDPGKESDISPRIARIFLFLCLSLGTFLRLYHFDMAPRWYSEDSGSNLFCLQTMADVADYQGCMTGKWDLMPAWIITFVSLYHSLPDIPPLLVQRLTNFVWDLGMVVVLYFAGKELAGRRMGLLAAALGAISKPSLLMLSNGWGLGPFNLVMSLVLLTSIRLMKKADPIRFLQWGASVGFLAYAHFYFSPFVPFFIFTIWAFIFFEDRNREKRSWPPPLAWATFLALFFYFLSNLNAFSQNNWIFRFIEWGGSWVPCLALGAVIICAVFSLPKSSLKNDSFLWVGWVAGAWLAVVLSYPIMDNLSTFIKFRFLVFLVPAIVFGSWAWVYYKKSTSRDWAKPSALVWGTFGILLFYFLYRANFFSDNGWVLRIIYFVRPWGICLYLSLLIFLAVRDLTRGSPRKSPSPWTGWVAGAWIGAIIAFPFTTSELILERIKMHTLVGGAGFLSGPYLLEAFHRMGGSFQKVFWGGGDRYDMSLPGDAYFGYPEVILIALGLAFCLARPNPRRLLLLLAAFMGVALHFFSNSNHGMRLLGCPVPFTLLGALGMNELVKSSVYQNKNKLFPAFVGVLLVSFGLWSGWAAFSRVYKQWFEVPAAITTAYAQTLDDLQKGRQVYWDTRMCGRQFSVLFESHPVHYWVKGIPVRLYVGSDEQGPDLVVYSREEALQEWTGAFPEASLSQLHENDDQNQTTAYRVQIPFSALSKPRQNLIKVIRVRAPYWHRTFGYFTMNVGFLSADDKTPNVNDPVKTNLENLIARYQAAIHFERGGIYEISCKTANRARILIDGKKTIDLFTPMTDGFYRPAGTSGTQALFLAPGYHQVQVDTCFQQVYGPPEVTLQLKGSDEPAKSLWGGFDF